MKIMGRLGFILSLSLLVSCSKDILAQNMEPDTLLPMNPKSEYIAIFGDIQYYTQSESNAAIYSKSIEWLNYQSTKTHINCIIHTGDITNGNLASGYERFRKSTELISNTVPYYSAIGNHDYTWGDGNKINDRYSTLINDYVDFPLSKCNVIDYFEEGRMENIVVKNSIFGERYDILILEFGPRKEVVEWADEYVSNHPDIKFILLNHEYLEKGGGRRVKGLTCKAQLANSSYTTPEELWNNLIYPNDNIVCVLCGHVGGLYALTYTPNITGREVPQIQHNIQSPAFRYDNWIMLWEFQQGNDSTSVKIVNANTQKFYNDSTTLFKFRYRY